MCFDSLISLQINGIPVVVVLFLTMNTVSNQPSAEMQENIASEARSAKTDTNLAEAMYYYAKGQTGIGEFMLRYAIETAKSRNERILPEEIGYIVSGGKGTPPESRNPDTTNEAEADLQVCAKSLRQELSQILGACNDIKTIIEEMSKELLTFIETLLAQPVSPPRAS